MKSLAKNMGIPIAVVDSMSADDLAVIGGQAALCEGHLDGNGDPLLHALLTFYLRALADRSTASRTV